MVRIGGRRVGENGENGGKRVSLRLTRFRRPVSASNSLVPGATTANGVDSGQLELPGAAPPHLLSVAPDGVWVAWVPESSLPDGFGRGGQPVFCVTDDPRSARTSGFPGWFGEQIALSSNAEHLEVVAVDRGLNRRLLTVKPATGETEHDLTELIARFSLGNVERLRFSASGSRLVLGSRESFLVLNLSAHNALFQGEGRFPSLSPSGEEVAFVDARGRLELAAVASGATRTLLDGATTYGVGSWTPDGSLLLAGVRGPLAFYWNLAAIDCTTGQYAAIRRLEEHDFGQHSGLIKRRLLSRVPTPSSQVISGKPVVVPSWWYGPPPHSAGPWRTA